MKYSRWILVPLLLTFDLNAQPRPDFNTPPMLSVPLNPTDVTAGDFNGDGKSDLAIGAEGPLGGGIWILMNDGSGQPAGLSEVLDAGSVNHLSIADLNSDGKMDLASVGRSAVSAFFGNGDGTFELAARYQIKAPAQWITTGDFDTDGKLDLAVSSVHTNHLSIYLNKGTNGFSEPLSIDAGESPWMVTTGDVNDDGNNDLITTNWRTNSISILFGDGKGAFDTRLRLEMGEVFRSPYHAAIADFTGDQKSDLLVFDSGGFASIWARAETGELRLLSRTRLLASPPSDLEIVDIDNDGKSDVVAVSDDNVVSILFGVGNGIFRAAYYGAGKKGVAVLDLNGDGKLDVATVHFLNNTMSLLFNKGDNTFGAPAAHLLGLDPLSKTAALGDFNKDGVLDFVAANDGTNTITLWNGDGRGGFSATTNIVTGENPRVLISADFDRDGRSDVAEIHLLTAVGVFLGMPDGSIKKSWEIDMPSAATQLLDGDFNGDNQTDIVVTRESWMLSLLVGNGDGTFSLRNSIELAVEPRALAKGDYNKDGRLDLALGNFDATVDILLGDGAGGFRQAFHYEIEGDLITDIGSADFNSDGIPDLAVTIAHDDAVRILLGTGDGGFTLSTRYPSGFYPTGLAIGDFNMDSTQDVVTSASGFVYFLPGNGDGTLQTSSRFIPGGYSLKVLSGDLNGDRQLDILATGGAAGVLLNQTFTTLAIERRTNSLALMWPGWTTGMRLEMSTNLTSATDWAPFLRSTTAFGGAYEVNIPPSESATYFRLRRQ